MPGGGLVVQQVAGPEVVRDVQVGQPVTGQVRGGRAQRPPGRVGIRDRVLDYLVAHGRIRSRGAAEPPEHVVATAVLRVGQRRRHLHVVDAIGVEHRGVREVVPDEQIGMAVAFEVGDGYRVGVPVRPVILPVHVLRQQLHRLVGTGRRSGRVRPAPGR